ncbi:MAG TPA: septal ring lytic transglycosylase RlpA family protein [Chitinophagaceae bacterium]|nr:septal ring lytic transglycosylase RlpA family protein [Chitinophagaceae bacterium]
MHERYNRKSYYGTASFYADKFEGRQTSSGERYQHDKFTAACNRIPLGTWIRVVNTRNRKSVIVRINDRLHPKNKRLVDLSKVAAQQLGYVRFGLTEVQVLVLGKVKPSGPLEPVK